MCLEDTVRIPLRARNGCIRAYALVDAADADWVNQWRWHLSKNNYVVRCQMIKKRNMGFLLHRELLGLTAGDGLEGDHINRNRLDNRRSNLRAVSKKINRQNQSGHRNAISVHRGVTRDARYNKWAAYIKVDRRGKFLGYFDREEDAAAAAKAARLHYFPGAVD